MMLFEYESLGTLIKAIAPLMIEIKASSLKTIRIFDIPICSFLISKLYKSIFMFTFLVMTICLNYFISSAIAKKKTSSVKGLILNILFWIFILSYWDEGLFSSFVDFFHGAIPEIIRWNERLLAVEAFIVTAIFIRILYSRLFLIKNLASKRMLLEVLFLAIEIIVYFTSSSLYEKIFEAIGCHYPLKVI